MATFWEDRLVKSVKWFENPEDASHLAFEMDGKEAATL